MVTGELKNKIDSLWNAMWNNGMTNPWINIQQVTYLIFIKMLDETQIKQERKYNDMKANGIDMTLDEDTLTFKSGEWVLDAEKGVSVPYKNLRWSVFKEFDSRVMFDTMRDHVFPFIKSLHGARQTAFANFMKEAQFTVTTPYILSKMVAALSDDVFRFGDRDVMGDCYEYLLSKMATSGDNGQFRTPRHIIAMMVALAAPTLKDTIIDPAMGSAGFLAESANYVHAKYARELMNKEHNKHFHNAMFTGFDTDTDMLRIGCMNMTLHGVDNPIIRYNNSLSEEYDESGKYSLILANPPFAGSLEPSTVAHSLISISGGAKKTELLFLSLFLRLLETGGRCFSIVPDGVLFGSSKSHKALRSELVDGQRLQAVISMPSGVFKPYSGVSTAILVFTKTNSGGTDKVWFYDMKADGFSLNDMRNPIADNDIPDIIHRFHHLDAEAERTRKDQSFLVPVEEIREQGYDLSINKYKEIERTQVVYESSEVIFSRIASLQEEINAALNDFQTKFM